jgi:hypothetical protein
MEKVSGDEGEGGREVEREKTRTTDVEARLLELVVVDLLDLNELRKREKSQLGDGERSQRGRKLTLMFSPSPPGKGAARAKAAKEAAKVRARVRVNILERLLRATESEEGESWDDERDRRGGATCRKPTSELLFLGFCGVQSSSKLRPHEPPQTNQQNRKGRA